MRSYLLALGLFLSFAGEALALDETWVSEGGQAKRLIGSLTLRINNGSGQIIFENGKVLSLQAVPGQQGLYRVDPPSDPIMRRGERLCDIEPGATKVLLESSDTGDRFFSVWAGEQRCGYYPMYEKRAYEKLRGELFGGHQ
jgi:hypothetical protein